MDKITWIDPYLDLVLKQVPLDAKSILEVGCGSGIFGFILKKTRDSKVDGIEPFGYDLNHYDHIIRSDWKSFYRSTTHKYDVLVSNETIEHMKKNDAIWFLHEAKSIADKVIITTPYTFDQQPAYDDNPLQVHQCVITKEDFEKEGYTVRIIGLKENESGHTRILYNPSHKLFAKLMGVTPMNIMGVWNKTLLSNTNQTSRVEA